MKAQLPRQLEDSDCHMERSSAVAVSSFRSSGLISAMHANSLYISLPGNTISSVPIKSQNSMMPNSADSAECWKGSEQVVDKTECFWSQLTVASLRASRDPYCHGEGKHKQQEHHKPKSFASQTNFKLYPLLILQGGGQIICRKEQAQRVAGKSIARYLDSLQRYRGLLAGFKPYVRAD